MKKYTNISQSQLSIARYYGGCIINGEEYIYLPKEDILVLKKDFDKENKVKRKKKLKKEPLPSLFI